jgi:hypothetical protein
VKTDDNSRATRTFPLKHSPSYRRDNGTKEYAVCCSNSDASEKYEQSWFRWRVVIYELVSIEVRTRRERREGRTHKHVQEHQESHSTSIPSTTVPRPPRVAHCPTCVMIYHNKLPALSVIRLPISAQSQYELQVSAAWIIEDLLDVPSAFDHPVCRNADSRNHLEK